MYRTIALCCLWISIAPTLFSQPFWEPTPHADRWVDSVLNQLSLEQKVAQMFMVTAYSNQGPSHVNSIRYILQKYQVGGLIFMQGDPLTQAQLTNEYQASSRVPLLIAQDAEWGLGMRLQGTQSYPRNLTLGAIRDDSLIFDLGAEIGYELNRIGVHMNFAPVVDVNNNPRNPVINDRSFGENKYNVARKGIMFSKGMESMGVLGCAKHFPGHGDTDTDSHVDLPILQHDLPRLDTLELYPFMHLINNDVPAMMVAHLSIPALDSTPHLGASLSPVIIQDLLRKKLKYQGLVITDALNMEGVTKHFSPGELAVQAVKAGNDILLSPTQVGASITALKRAIDAGEIHPWIIDARVRRILYAKYRVGLNRFRPISLNNIQQEINDVHTRILQKRLYEGALTLPLNQQRLLPLHHLEQRKIAYIQIGGGANNAFEQRMKKYADITVFYLPQYLQPRDRLNVLRATQGFNTFIVGVFGMNNRASNRFGVSREAALLCEELNQRPVANILTLFGSPYGLQYFGGEDAILVAYEDSKEAQEGAASALFGGLPVNGRLPVTGSDQFPQGAGEWITHPIRFGFAYPESLHFSSATLNKIDSIAETHIRDEAMPGCAVLVAKGNHIIFDRAYGKTEQYGVPVDPYRHMYDLASITKIATTTLITMRLVEQNLLDLDAPILQYLPELRHKDIGQLTVRRMLQHNAGLASWIPFYARTYSDERNRIPDKRFYSKYPTATYSVPVSAGMYQHPVLLDSIWTWMQHLEVRNTSRVRYSDLGPILVGKVIEAITQESLEAYAQRNFYQPLGMSRTVFNPAEKGLTQDCPPTEMDDYWRKSRIQGFVNDPTAAMMGGIAGHAGLFANVYDLAKLMFMLKDGGTYGERFFLNPQTVRDFTRQQLTHSRRGLGFDKPEINPRYTTPVSDLSSRATFGHTGFTGTCAWVDPEYDLIFIFLSNRTYPSKRNRKLIHDNVRTKIMDKIYEAMQGQALISP